MLRTHCKTGLKQHAGRIDAKTPRPNQAAAAAFRQGKAAGRQGKPDTDNPFDYTAKTGLAAWWSKGWQEGRR